MELSVDGGLVEMINRITAAQDGKQIIALFKDIILRAYGQKSPDGRRFVKNQELRDEFAQTGPIAICLWNWRLMRRLPLISSTALFLRLRRRILLPIRRLWQFAKDRKGDWGCWKL